MNDPRGEALERALGYPFPVPARSFALVRGRRVELADAQVDRRSRVPLLAYGSNAAPSVLARKLGEEADPVAAVRGALLGFDAVFSAHLAAYGSVPATLRRSPGTELPLFVVYVTEAQLRLLSATEPNYRLRPMDGLRCRLEDGEVVAAAHVYLSRHGCLAVEGEPRALREVAARNRTLAEMSQREALDHVRRRLRPELGLEEFVQEWVGGRAPATGRLDSAEAP